MSPTMIAARRRGIPPCGGGSFGFPDLKLRISPIAGGLHKSTRGGPSLRLRETIVCERYHIDEPGQCRRNRRQRVPESEGLQLLEPSWPNLRLKQRSERI